MGEREYDTFYNYNYDYNYNYNYNYKIQSKETHMNITDKEKRTEASVNMQARVDIRVLAELDGYWSSKGYTISTVSQLICWSIEAFREILELNKLLPKKIDDVGEGYWHMQARALVKKGYKERISKRMNTAMGFSEIRLGGDDPKHEAPARFKHVHERARKSSEMYPRSERQEDIENTEKFNEAIEDISKITAEAAEAENKKVKEKIKQMVGPDGLVDTSLHSTGKEVESKMPVDWSSPTTPRKEIAKEYVEKKKRKIDDDTPRPMTDEELHAKDEKHEKRSREEHDALGSVPEGIEVVEVVEDEQSESSINSQTDNDTAGINGESDNNNTADTDR